jgi:hypothetical protein
VPRSSPKENLRAPKTTLDRVQALFSIRGTRRIAAIFYLYEILARHNGEPTKKTENPRSPGTLSGATWRNSIGYLTILDYSTSIEITSGLNDTGESKDI